MREITDGVQPIIPAIADKAVWTGSVTTVASWFAASDFGILAGIAIGVAGLVINWYFKHKADKRMEVNHQVYLLLVETQINLKAPLPLVLPEEDKA